MMKFRQKLLAGIGVLALSATPTLAGNALPQEGAGTTTGAVDASAPQNVEDLGYSNIEPVRRASVPADRLAFNAVDPVGNPVLLIVDRSTGRVVGEGEMRTLPTPSKNQ
ncbi:MAG: hypothetical protein AMXMBFR74_12680 [Parvibaculum sp.]|uniref:hypothetical protein n=1 Tax=Parvibaculum sp. TaxID=2024848 RepID=UPI0035B71719